MAPDGENLPPMQAGGAYRDTALSESVQVPARQRPSLHGQGPAEYLTLSATNLRLKRILCVAHPPTTRTAPGAAVYHVQTRQSPYFDVFHDHHVIRVTVDSGATGNMIRHSTVKRLGSRILSSAHRLVTIRS